MIRIGSSHLASASKRRLPAKSLHKAACRYSTIALDSIIRTFHPQNASRTIPVRQFSSSTKASKTGMEPHMTNLIDGPPVHFGIGKIANLTESSVVGSSGQTVALTTMAAAPLEDMNSGRSKSVTDCLRQHCQAQSSFVPLTVDYRQRHHAVGKIPTTANRSDNQRPTDGETLASRAIDRALRPMLKQSSDSIHVSCSIQSCPDEEGLGGHPVALALNSASVALRDRLEESVACVYFTLLEDGTVVMDSSRQDETAVCTLLYAGTREKIVMMEFSGFLEEPRLTDLITLAHGCIQPLLDIQATFVSLGDGKTSERVDDNALRAELGLPTVEADETLFDVDNVKIAESIFDQALAFCQKRLSDSSLRVFGVVDPSRDVDQIIKNVPRLHPADETPLLSKSHRGRRENLFQQEISRILRTFEPEQYQQEFASIRDSNPALVNYMADPIHSKLLKAAIGNAAVYHNCRADGRGAESGNGCMTIRTLSMEVPALPNVVHGSALFTRGETQVLCTTTLGPPKDGILLNDPFSMPKERSHKEEQRPSDELPVGSLRYLKTQEYLESDLNSRKVRADREQTGDSGVLKERRRAFLQYDFPAYSKGEVQSGPRGSNRREIGHGALAEKAVLPILPTANEFPYAIRMTSEVTSSNGSSSMASVCGATLALLDAGVPIKAPVAGVSVGLARKDLQDEHYKLLLDITGTEDHYGIMDFKIAGTRDAVTALHLDVHEPLSHHIVFEALALANDARGVLLSEMEAQSTVSSEKSISGLRPRSELKASAPRVEVVRFDPMRKKDLLGPGGAVIRQMEDRFNVSLDLTQEGQCLLFGDDREMVRKAKVAVMDLVSDVEVGEVYEGTVIELRDFGVIIELLRNKEGICHVSELALREEIRSHPKGTIGLIQSMLHVGQKIDVECTAVDPVMGSILVKPARKENLK